MKCKKAIILNDELNLNNPPAGAVMITFDENKGFEFIEDNKPVASISVNGLAYTPVDALAKVDKSYYSAFEVMPSKTAIKDYYREIPACTVHKMTLRSANPVEGNDVVIDWGDGCVEALADGKYEWIKNKQYNIEHDYADAMTEDVQKFIVKIYGKNYYTFRHNDAVTLSSNNTKLTASNNLISRIFDVDLPIASHITNFASMCYGALRLIEVKIPHSTKYITDGYNFSSTFQYAENLVSVTGFVDNLLRSNCHVGNMFAYCYSLTTTDMEIPAIPATSESTGNPTIGGIFNNCSKLTAKVEKLLPGGGFAVNNVDMNLAFYNTSALTGTIPVDRLWNSGKTWNKTSSTFKGSALASQAPTNWGGTKTEAKAE
jgi:hypothetical protein